MNPFDSDEFSPLKIGALTIKNPLILAPMAGITDAPFRALCRRFGATLTVSEMVTSNPQLQSDRKTRLRTRPTAVDGIHAVQILGNEPTAMAEAARLNVAQGATLIDINMGCPAKKVCRKAAGSALMRETRLVTQILESVVRSVEVPVTLKIRTGWDPQNRNALEIAKIAESSGIQALTIHGRTRACGFSGEAEYRTIAEVKQGVRIPVIANGDITTPTKAREVLKATGANAVMIGRAALGQPWFFSALRECLFGIPPDKILTPRDHADLIGQHLEALYLLYGVHQGVRVARKHVGWYLGHLQGLSDTRQAFNQQTTPEGQQSILSETFGLRAHT